MIPNVIQDIYRVIRNRPEDLEPRWVLADWYEEQGDLPLAQLIRTQLRLAELNHWDPQTVDLKLEARTYLEATQGRWQNGLPTHDGIKWATPAKGLSTKVAFNSFDAFLSYGADCFEARPVHSLILCWPRFGLKPELEPIEGLGELTMIGPLMSSEDMAWLAQSPILSTIHTLNLIETEMRSDGLEELLKSPFAVNFRTLRLPYNNFVSEDIELLVQAELPALAELDLSVASLDELGSGGRDEPAIGKEGAQLLAQWPTLSHVHNLDLTGHCIGVDGLTHLLASPHIRNIKTLGIRCMDDYYMDDPETGALAAFASAHPALRLEELDISENRISSDIAKILKSATCLAKLKNLSINYAAVRFEITELVQATWFDSLRVLSMNDCDESHATTLLKRQPKNLHTLNLTCQYGWSQIVSASTLFDKTPIQNTLRCLDLSGNILTQDFVDTLGETQLLPQLTELKVGAEYMSNANIRSVVEQFLKSSLGQQLQSFEVWGEGLQNFNRLVEPKSIDAIFDRMYERRFRWL